MDIKIMPELGMSDQERESIEDGFKKSMKITGAMVEAGLKAAEKAAAEFVFGNADDFDGFSERFQKQFRVLHRAALEAAFVAPPSRGSVVWEWQDISTAPKDRLILLAAEFFGDDDWRVKVGGWREDFNSWQIFGGSWQPTHWMPLPTPPTPRALIPEVNLSIRHEEMAEFFHKYHIDGLPFPAVIHHFTDIDRGDPHDHPFGFQSVILHGGYIEEVFDPKRGLINVIARPPEDSFIIEATHIHRIISLPMGECITLMLPSEKVREPGFWQWRDGGAWFRQWNWQEWVRQ